MTRFRLISLCLAAAIGLAVPAAAHAQAATVTPHLAAVPQAAAASVHQGDPQVSVNPRVSCGGFNGNVAWTSSHIQIWGQIWNDSCSNNTTLFLTWNDLSGHHNPQVTQVNGFGNSIGVSVHTYGTSGAPSSGSVTVCSTYGGWHCGTPQGF